MLKTEPAFESRSVKRTPNAILNPKVFTGELKLALETAGRDQEPLFLPTTIYADDRGWSIMNQYQGVLTPDGQINYSLMYPGVIKAWHRHRFQADLWLCVNGQVRAGVHREADGQSWSIVMGEMRPGILVIPSPLWHGVATVSHLPAGLLYYVTRAFNPQAPDEERRPFDSVPDFPWTVQNR